MNIANIFGPYLGCMVEALFGPYSYKLYSVNREGGAYVDDLKTDERLYVKLENCKLLLTPLDKITEEDKREFQDKFLLKNRKIRHFQNTMYGTTIYFAESEIFTDRAGCNNEMAFWLASKGYDIGICPKEYKEIAK